MFTPLAGMPAYATKGAVGQSIKLEEVFKGAIPFLILNYIFVFDMFASGHRVILARENDRKILLI